MPRRVRTLLRFLLIIAAAAGLWLWLRPDDAPPEPPAASRQAPPDSEFPPPPVSDGVPVRTAPVRAAWEEIAAAAGAGADSLPGPGLTEEQIEFEQLPGSLLFPRSPMTMEAAIWRAYQMIATNPAVDAVELGRGMLSATSAWVRTTGAIWMLEKNRRLPPEVLDGLIADQEAFVPLTVMGWMLDAGMEAEAGAFDARWTSAPQEAWTAAIDALLDEPLNGMAGRASLWMADRSSLPDPEKQQLMADVVANTNSAYDVRWKAAMLLQRRMDHAAYRRMLLDLLDFAALPPPFLPEHSRPERAAREEEPLELLDQDSFPVAMGLLNARMAVPEAIARNPVLEETDVDLFFARESSLMLENIALWVEAAVDRQGVAVRPGFTAALSRRLADLPAGELPANQRLSLRRIQSRLDRLAQIERAAPHGN